MQARFKRSNAGGGRKSVGIDLGGRISEEKRVPLFLYIEHAAIWVSSRVRGTATLRLGSDAPPDRLATKNTKST